MFKKTVAELRQINREVNSTNNKFRKTREFYIEKDKEVPTKMFIRICWQKCIKKIIINN